MSWNFKDTFPYQLLSSAPQNSSQMGLQSAAELQSWKLELGNRDRALEGLHQQLTASGFIDDHVEP